MLDFATCTECGRCQSQCPAWNTGKPLSPKLVIMDLRDHLFAKAPYLLARGGGPATGRRAAWRDRDRRGRTEAAEAGAARRRPRVRLLAGAAPARPRPNGRWSAPPRRAG